MAAEQGNGEYRCKHITYSISLEITVLVGVIGGSGLYHLDNLTFVYVYTKSYQMTGSNRVSPGNM